MKDFPKTWDELRDVAKKLAEGDKYLYQWSAESFHGSQWILKTAAAC